MLKNLKRRINNFLMTIEPLKKTKIPLNQRLKFKPLKGKKIISL
jgi:hypothetical protein